MPWPENSVGRSGCSANTTPASRPSAEWGSLPIEDGAAVVYRREIAQAPDPAKRQQELEAELLAMNSPLRTAEAFGVEDMIDPRDTRQWHVGRYLPPSVR
ncbi:MAG: hypothetical protein O7G88_08680 [bacterium]|nr:hypothetical protein [bacterium]